MPNWRVSARSSPAFSLPVACQGIGHWPGTSPTACQRPRPHTFTVFASQPQANAVSPASSNTLSGCQVWARKAGQGHPTHLTAPAWHSHPCPACLPCPAPRLLCVATTCPSAFSFTTAPALPPSLLRPGFLPCTGPWEGK